MERCLGGGPTMRASTLVALVGTVLLAVSVGCAADLDGQPSNPLVTVGSKVFTESVVLGEIVTLLARSTGTRVQHRKQLGGTRVLWNALVSGEIDVYVEYTGTLSEEIFSGDVGAGWKELEPIVRTHGLLMSQPLGFSNTYAVGMMAAEASRLGIRSISDLVAHPRLRLGFSNEFMDRGDGWPSLRDRYGLPHLGVRGLDHDLSYRALESGSIDVTELYSTDAEIEYYGLQVLEDDRDHFPDYEAVLLVRLDLRRRSPEVIAALRRLENRIDETTMIRLNASAKLDLVPDSVIAAGFLRTALGLQVVSQQEGWLGSLWRHTVTHLSLVGVSLLGAILLAVPLGIVAAKQPRLGAVIMGTVGILQTVPSLALLVLMVPLLGIGAPPAIAALFLYSLLPIVRNTASGLIEISPAIRESAEAMGLPPFARLTRVELPIASRSILAGVKTAAVINVGTATLGALIGAGGYGQPILTGIRLDDTNLILQGAVPAAALALVVQGLFELSERVFVPRGLRLTDG